MAALINLEGEVRKGKRFKPSLTLETYVHWGSYEGEEEAAPVLQQKAAGGGMGAAALPPQLLGAAGSGAAPMGAGLRRPSPLKRVEVLGLVSKGRPLLLFAPAPVCVDTLAARWFRLLLWTCLARCRLLLLPL